MINIIDFQKKIFKYFNNGFKYFLRFIYKIKAELKYLNRN